MTLDIHMTYWMSDDIFSRYNVQVLRNGLQVKLVLLYFIKLHYPYTIPNSDLDERKLWGIGKSSNIIFFSAKYYLQQSTFISGGTISINKTSRLTY